jgi:hypothetical protein
MTRERPAWLSRFPESTQNLFDDSSLIQPEVYPIHESKPQVGELCFLYSRQLDKEQTIGPRLVYICSDLGNDLFQVALTHCESELAAFSDIKLLGEETNLDYPVFVSTAVLNIADGPQLTQSVGRATAQAVSLVETVIKRKAIDENWRRGKKFSANAFVASLDPRWKFVTEEVRELQLLCQASLYHEDFDLEEMESVFTSDQIEALFPGGLAVITSDLEMDEFAERLNTLQNA